MASKPAGLELLLGMGPPKGSSMPGGDGDGDEMGEDVGAPDELLVGAGQEVMSAMHNRDPDQFAMALKSFIDMAR